MSSKSIIMLLLAIGSTVGSYLPVLFGAGVLSYTSVIGGAIGGIIGVYIGYKLTEGM